MRTSTVAPFNETTNEMWWLFSLSSQVNTCCPNLPVLVKRGILCKLVWSELWRSKSDTIEIPSSLGYLYLEMFSKYEKCKNNEYNQCLLWRGNYFLSLRLIRLCKVATNKYVRLISIYVTMMLGWQIERVWNVTYLHDLKKNKGFHRSRRPVTGPLIP